MAIVYKHIRLDRNEVFYIGIGTKLERAYRRSQRNKQWLEVVNETEIKIEIIYDNVSIDAARRIERNLIKEYGRINLNTGTLVNLTDGGEGVANFKRTEDQIYFLKNNRIGLKDSKEVISKKQESSFRAKLVLNQSTGIFYTSCALAAETIGMERTRLNKMLSGLIKNKTDFILV